MGDTLGPHEGDAGMLLVATSFSIFDAFGESACTIVRVILEDLLKPEVDGGNVIELIIFFEGTVLRLGAKVEILVRVEVGMVVVEGDRILGEFGVTVFDGTTLVEIEDINVGRIVVGTTLGLRLLGITLGPLDGATEGEYFEDIKDGKVLVGKADGLIL